MVEDADYETELYYTSYIELMTLKFKMKLASFTFV